MPTSTPEQIRNIYERWHDGFNRNDLAGIMALYAEQATIETPTVLAVYPEAREGLLHGRAAIEELFGKILSNISSDFKELFRTGVFLTKDNLLLWEYPRLTPSGEQLDLVESMDIEDGLIAYHRVYWGWRGYKRLMESVVRRPPPP